MKKSLVVSGITLLVGALIIPVVVSALEVRVGESPSFTSSETTKNDLYLAGGSITSSGKVNGDLIVGGGNILINGAVSQDLAVGGGSITIVADIGDDVRIGGGTIVVSGKIGGDLVLGGGQTTISGAGIGGDILWAGGMLRIDAPVGGNLQLGGGDVTINAPIRGNVQFKGTKLTLGKNAVISGDLTYSAESEATMETGAVVKGKTNYEPRPARTSGFSVKAIFAILSLLFLGKFLASLVFALALGLTFHRYTIELVTSAMEQPLLEMGRGLIALIVLPIASILFLVTLIGFIFGILGLISFVGALIFACAFAAIIVGSVVYKWFFKTPEYEVTWKTILLGVFLYTLLGLIPIVGGIATFLLMLLALGTLIKIKWQMVQEWR